MNTKNEEKARTRSASKRADSAGVTKPNTVSPKARKPTPKVNHSSSSKPRVNNNPPLQVTPVKTTKAYSKDTPNPPQQFVCNSCAILKSSPSDIREAVADIKEALLEAKIQTTGLTLQTRHLIVDPKRSLETLGEQASRVASLCKTVEDRFDNFQKLLTLQFRSLTSKVDNLLPTPDHSDKLVKIIEEALESRIPPQPPSSVAAIETLTKRLDELAAENREIKKTVCEELNSALQIQLKEHSDRMRDLVMTAQAPDLPQKHPPQAQTTTHHLNNIKQGSATTSPYDELALNFLRDQDLESLVDLLNNMVFTELLGSREVEYYGQFKYPYGSVVHEANVAYPEIIKIIMEKINTKYGTNLNSCLITKYLNGLAVCPPHPDNEPSINPASPIITLTVGADGVRNMVFRSLTDNSIVQNLTLPDNSLLVFSRKSQEFFSHAIPADSTVKGVRFSLTFREISPYFLNSTCLIGDSNCWSMNFASRTKHCFGKWMPGESIHTPRIHQIPEPESLLPYRNFLLNVGINDLDRSAPLPPHVLVQQLEKKCYAIHNTYPKANILLSPVLPTKDRFLNNRVREFNDYLRCLADKDQRLHLLNHHDTFTTPSSGLLAGEYASRKRHDIKHLNHSGIVTLKNLFKDAVMNIRKRPRNRNSNFSWEYPKSSVQSSRKEQSSKPEIIRHCKQLSECESEGSDVEYVMPELEGESDVDCSGPVALDSESGALVLFVVAPTSDPSPPSQHPPPLS